MRVEFDSVIKHMQDMCKNYRQLLARSRSELQLENSITSLNCLMEQAGNAADDLRFMVATRRVRAMGGPAGPTGNKSAEKGHTKIIKGIYR